MSGVRSQFQEGQTDRVATVATTRRRRGRGGRGVVVTGLVVVVLAGAGVVAVEVPGVWKHSGAASIDNNVATTTAVVLRRKLTSQVQVNGTLGYSGDYGVPNRMNGTATKLPAEGQVIKHGQVLYRVDGKPAILLYGKSVPSYRALSRSMKGGDVRQLNAELVALGYASSSDLSPTSSYFSAATKIAVRKMQKALGASETGTVDLGQIVFLPMREVRVTTVNGTYGNAASPGDILKVTSTTRTVTVSMPAAELGSVRTGDAATVTLPNQQTTPGKVSSISAVAVKSSSGTYTIDIEIALTRPGDTGKLDQAPVQVAITSDSVDHALAVPVNALLALSGGGYAIEVVDAAGVRRLVPVTTGLFDDSAGLVQITGAGVAAGQKIVVPGQ